MVGWTSASHAPEIAQHAEICLSSVVVASPKMVFSFSGSISESVIEAILYAQLSTPSSVHLEVEVSRALTRATVIIIVIAPIQGIVVALSARESRFALG